MSKLNRLSKIVMCLFIGAIFLAPVLMLIPYFVAPQDVISCSALSLPCASTLAQGFYDLPWMLKAQSIVVSSLPLMMSMYLYYVLAKLFALFCGNEIFSEKTTHYISVASVCFLVTQILDKVASVFNSYLITSSTSGSNVSITVGTADFYNITVALIFFIIARVLHVGYRIEQEQLLTV